LSILVPDIFIQYYLVVYFGFLDKIPVVTYSILRVGFTPEVAKRHK
jgi:hypothetical protein